MYDTPEREIVDFARRIDGEPDRCTRFSRWICQWLGSRDAECVVVYAETEPGSGLVVANDVLGRLPLYLAHENGRLHVGREIKVIAALLDSVQPDRLGVAETIQFGFPLGKKTLLAGIARLAPGSLVRSDPSGDFRIARYYRWRLDDREAAAGPSPDDLRRATGVFAEACRRRVDRFPDRPPVLLLSGGLDSRAVAGGLTRAQVAFRSVAFHGADGYMAAERDIAAQVAETVGCPLDEIVLSSPRPWHRQWAVDIRDGSALALLAYLFQVHQCVRDGWQSGGLVFTGDGGGQVMPPHVAWHSRRSPRNLTPFLFSHISWFDSGIAARLTGLSRRDFIASVDAHIGRYPETTAEERYMRFNVFERGFRWLGEGEERMRAFTWMTTPFYARPFFETAMRVPYAWKRDNTWFRAFLHELSPPLASITYANTGLPPGVSVRRKSDTAKALIERFPPLDMWLRDWNCRRKLRQSVCTEAWEAGSPEECRFSPLVQAAFDMDQLTPLMAEPLNARLYWQLTSLLWYFRRTDQNRACLAPSTRTKLDVAADAKKTAAPDWKRRIETAL